MQKYAFFDVDQTIYDGYSTSDFYLFLGEKGLGPKNLVEIHNQLEADYVAGATDYNQTAQRVYDLNNQVIRGLHRNEMLEYQNEFISQTPKLFAYAQSLFALLESYHFHTYLISAATDPVIEALGRYLETDRYYASEMEVIDDIYTGNLLTVRNNEEKKKMVHQIIDTKTQTGLTLGFGDSTGDAEMLSAVDKAFVINPHQKEIKDLAKQQGWPVVTGETVLEAVQKVLDQELK